MEGRDVEHIMGGLLLRFLLLQPSGPCVELLLGLCGGELDDVEDGILVTPKAIACAAPTRVGSRLLMLYTGVRVAAGGGFGRERE